jgi:hypothetical protein
MAKKSRNFSKFLDLLKNYFFPYSFKYLAKIFPLIKFAQKFVHKNAAILENKKGLYANLLGYLAVFL